MKSSFLFNSTFRCYKVSTVTAVSSGIQDIINDTFKDTLKNLVIESIYKDIQIKKQSERLFNDLFDDSEDYELNELTNLIRVDHKYESINVGEKQYVINYLSIRSNDSNIFKPQLFIFITDGNCSKNFNTVLLVRSIPRLSSVLLKLLVNESGLLLNTLKVSSDVLKNCLDFNIGELVRYKSSLELTFSNFQTINNSLSNITINIEHGDLKRLAESPTFSHALFKHLESETAISFDKIDITKISCNIFYLNSDGRLKLFNDYSIGQRSEDTTVSWYIIRQLF